jgi:hypothetical protein
VCSSEMDKNRAKIVLTNLTRHHFSNNLRSYGTPLMKHNVFRVRLFRVSKKASSVLAQTLHGFSQPFHVNTELVS